MEKKLILSGEERNYELDRIAWKRVVVLAAAYGWKPEGPDKADIEEHPGQDYIIGKEDAQALAESLENANPWITCRCAYNSSNSSATFCTASLTRFLDSCQP